MISLYAPLVTQMKYSLVPRSDLPPAPMRLFSSRPPTDEEMGVAWMCAVFGAIVDSAAWAKPVAEDGAA